MWAQGVEFLARKLKLKKTSPGELRRVSYSNERRADRCFACFS